MDQLDRRGFLRLAGAGVITASSGLAVPRQVRAESTEPIAGRKPPVHPVVLRSDVLEITLDRSDGLPYSYRLFGRPAEMRGEDSGAPIAVTVCRKHPWEFVEALASVTGVKATGSTATFSFKVESGGVHAAYFSLLYALYEASLTITIENVAESDGFEFIRADLPQLVTVRDDDANAWLVHGDTGGSFANLHEASADTLPLNQFWGNVAGTLPVVMVGHASAMCVQETTAFMDGTLLTVTRQQGRVRAAIGTSKTHRVNGGACYDLNLPKGMPRNCGVAATPNLLIEQKSSCRLDFLPVTGDVRDAWLAGAKLVRARMPKIPTTLYRDKYVFGIRCDEPLFPKPTATFSECEGLIRDVHDLTDGAAQVVHLWGWQFKGKDTGYPAVDVVNERIGGYDGMMKLMQAGKELNAIVTLSDNYDDGYRSSPEWNEAVVAHRPDGELWKSRSWTGEESYILGLAKYMEGPGVERVRYTCERYKLHATTHVDVLSYYAIRNDWDPAHPASGIRNLTAGRYRVLEEFARHGVDVSSEALRYPMIGHISNFWYAQASGSCPFGGSRIPLLPLIYRQSAVWGYSGGSRADHSLDRLNQVFYGACPHSILRADIDRGEISDTWYLGVLPWFNLHSLNIESFRNEGATSTIVMEENTHVSIDWARKAYRVVLRGSEVAHEDSVFCPIDRDKVAFYAITPQKLRAALPAGWKHEEMSAIRLSTGQRHAAVFDVVDGFIEVGVDVRQPVIVYRHTGMPARDRKLP